jgi:hypothetical protein
MPELWLLGFRGATRASYRAFADTDPLLYTGHVGLSFDHGTTIYGFSPHAPSEVPRAVIDRLKRGGTYPGIVRDDRTVFERAATAAARNLLGSPIHLWAQELDAPILERIRARFQAEPLGRPLATKRYGWLIAREGVYNCATWPRSLGVTLPEDTGQLADFIAALRIVSGGREWTP